MSQANLFDLDRIPPAPSRQSGLDRLHAFAPAMGARYARTRNFDWGPDPAEPRIWPTPDKRMPSLVLLHEEDAQPESWA